MARPEDILGISRGYLGDFLGNFLGDILVDILGDILGSILGDILEDILGNILVDILGDILVLYICYHSWGNLSFLLCHISYFTISTLCTAIRVHVAESRIQIKNLNQIQR